MTATKKLELASNLKLPLDAATQKLAFLARSGAGKTYGAGKFVEEMSAAGSQYVVVDPVGVWWGLRLAADGESPGITNVYVFGGPRGDVPLEPAAGELVAGIIVDHGISVVLDVSEMTGGEMRRFVADFATELLRRKKMARSPVMVVWEECQDFVPQKVMHDSARMVGAVEKLVKQGRNHGVGTTLISQRPQAVNKDVLNQTECLIVLQTTGPQERKTIAGWVVENAEQVSDAVDKLPSLSRGEAFVWSPQWLKTFKKIHIGKKWTYDASSTPEFGEADDARKLAPVDLDAIHAAMQDTLERKEAEDPTALRAALAKARAELTKAKEGLASKKTPATKTERVEVPMLTEKDVQRFEAACARMQKKLDEHLRELAPLQERLTAASHEILAKMSAAMKQARIPLPTQAPAAAHTRAAPRRARAPRSAEGATDGALPVGERAVLEALIQFADGLRPEQLTVLTTYKRSTRNAYIARLRERGYVESEADRVRATAAGRAALPDAQPLPTGSALREHWRTRLPAGEWAILDVLIRAYPQIITRDELDAATGFKRSTRNAYISRLEAKELVVDAGYSQVKAAEMLFD